MTTNIRSEIEYAAAARLGIDHRALAAFRVLLGLCLLLDIVLVRLPAARTFYADDGVFPRSALAETYPLFADLSLHALSGAVWFQVVLFLTLAAAATAIILGYRTRPAVAVAVVLLASMQARNPLVLSGGDTIMLLLLVFGLALPLDARWSLRSTDATGTRCVSAVSASTLLFLVMVYFTNGLLKLESEAWVRGEAVAQIGHVSGYWNPIGAAFTEATSVLPIVNWAWMGLLLASPLLVLGRGRARTAVAGGLIIAQAGMVATLWIGVFPLVLLTGLLLFLPSPVWDRVEASIGTPSIDRLPIPAWLSRTTGDERSSGEPPAPPVGRWPSAATRRRSVAAVLVVLLLAMTAWQVTATGLVDGPSPELESSPTNPNWAMFQHPPAAETWYVLEGTLASGDTVDVLRGGEPTLDGPPTGADRHESWSWMRYGMQLRWGDERLFAPLAAYGCGPVEGTTTVTVIRIDQPIGPGGPTGDPIVSRIATAAC